MAKIWMWNRVGLVKKEETGKKCCFADYKKTDRKSCAHASSRKTRKTQDDDNCAFVGSNLGMSFVKKIGGGEVGRIG